MRVSLKDAQKLLKDGNAKVNSGSKAEFEKACLAAKEPKRTKYGNRKVELDGHIFDSQWESEVYLVLKDKKRCGEIKDFSLQPEYVLQEGYRDGGGSWVRPIIYRGDFEVTNLDGSIEVIDAKGFETKEFKIKKKLFEQKYLGLKLRIIKRGDAI